MDPKNSQRSGSRAQVIALPREASPRPGGSEQRFATELGLTEEGMAALSRLLEPAFFGRRRRSA